MSDESAGQWLSQAEIHFYRDDNVGILLNIRTPEQHISFMEILTAYSLLRRTLHAVRTHPILQVLAKTLATAAQDLKGFASYKSPFKLGPIAEGEKSKKILFNIEYDPQKSTSLTNLSQKNFKLFSIPNGDIAVYSTFGATLFLQWLVIKHLKDEEFLKGLGLACKDCAKVYFDNRAGVLIDLVDGEQREVAVAKKCVQLSGQLKL